MKTAGTAAAAAQCVTTLGACKMLEQLKKSGEAAAQAGSASSKAISTA